MTSRLVLTLTLIAGAAVVAAAGLESGGTVSVQPAPNHKQQVIDLLKSIETGAPGPVAVINPTKYTQHNLAAADGLAGFGELMKQLPPGSAKVNTRRVLQDGDFVIAHARYNFFGPKIRLRHLPFRRRPHRRALGQPADDGATQSGRPHDD